MPRLSARQRRIPCDRQLVLTAVCMLQITLTHGLRSAKAAPAIATSYLSVVWGILGSLFIFHEVRTVLLSQLAKLDPILFCNPGFPNLNQ